MAVRPGNIVRDNITGFSGTVLSRCEYLFGCVRCEVQPKELKDGKMIESQFIDEQRLDVIDNGGPVISAASRAPNGGPQNNPPRA